MATPLSDDPFLPDLAFVETNLDRRGSVPRHNAGLAGFIRRYASNPTALLGLALLLGISLLALCAPFISQGNAPDTSFHVGIGTISGIGPSLDDFPIRIFGMTSADDLRRSVFLEVIWGARPTLLIGFAAALLSAGIGVILGAISGYYGGWIDGLIMRLTDLFLALPFLPLVIALIVASALAQQTPLTLILIFGIVGWSTIARLVRAQFLILREQSFTEAARAVGVGDLRIIFRHLMPSALTPIIVATTFSVTSFILAESTLDFLQLSNLGQITWGFTIATGVDYLIANMWWWVFFPSLFLILTTLAVNYIGEGLRDALDVRTRTY